MLCIIRARTRLIATRTVVIAPVVVIITVLTVWVVITAVRTRLICTLVTLRCVTALLAVSCRRLSVIHFFVAGKIIGFTVRAISLTDTRTFGFLFVFVRFHNSALIFYKQCNLLKIHLMLQINFFVVRPLGHSFSNKFNCQLFV